MESSENTIHGSFKDAIKNKNKNKNFHFLPLFSSNPCLLKQKSQSVMSNYKITSLEAVANALCSYVVGYQLEGFLFFIFRPILKIKNSNLLIRPAQK